jgi:hypothetical protein
MPYLRILIVRGSIWPYILFSLFEINWCAGEVFFFLPGSIQSYI